MKIDSALRVSEAGLQNGFQSLRNTALDIAGAAGRGDGVETTTSLARLLADKHYILANAKAFEVIGDVIGSLLDVRA